MGVEHRYVGRPRAFLPQRAEQAPYCETRTARGSHRTAAGTDRDTRSRTSGASVIGWARRERDEHTSTHHPPTSEEERREIDVDELPGPLRRLFQNEDEINEAQALLRRVQGALRANPGVNAFLALDIDVDTDDVDAMTQSLEYTRCSDATAFVVPFLGHNFGVGEEAGSILETLADTHGERLIFVHEADVTSATIRLANVR